MFIKTNQGLGRTNRNKKKKGQNNETKTKPNQTKKEKKKKKVTPPKTCALTLMIVYANQRKMGEQPTFHQFLTLVI